ncbi:MAG: nucleotidyltransferase family protein [Gemmatimonadota bacterium]
MSPSERAPGSTTRPGVVGVVPASGASSRMGRPKGLLRLDGRTFTRRVVEALVEGGCDRVLVVVRAGDEAIAGEVRTAGAEVLENPDPGDGPITSLRLALTHLTNDVGWVVWLPLDHPKVQPGTVRALIEAKPPVLALPVHRGQRGHPAVFGRAVFAELLDPDLAGGARTVVHRHLDAGTALLLETDDPGVLVDVDTPEEYEALVRDDAR